MKYVLVALLVLIGAFQVQAASRFLVGVKAGPVLADALISGSNMGGAPYKPKAGLTAGGSFEWIPKAQSPRVQAGIRLDLLYVQKGWKAQSQHTDENGRNLGWLTDETIYLDEFVIAPMLILRHSESVLTPYLLIGPEAGFKQSVIVKHNYDGLGKHSLGWNGTNFGFNAGVGAAMKLNRGELSAELRYYLDWTDLPTSNNYTNAQALADISAHTNGIQLLLGYSLDVAGRN
jgi:hypothetical protein